MHGKWKEGVGGSMQTLIKKVTQGGSDDVKGCAGNWQAHLYQCLFCRLDGAC